MATFYAIILLYPIISFLFNKFVVGEDGSILLQIASEIYLWIGFTITYIGVIILLYFGTGGALSLFWAFIFYTIGYFAVSVIRKTIFTDTKEDYSPN